MSEYKVNLNDYNENPPTPWTDEQFYKAKDSGVSNSQLYKQAGNSVSVPVVDAIVKEFKQFCSDRGLSIEE